jgi:hypothetical protein
MMLRPAECKTGVVLRVELRPRKVPNHHSVTGEINKFNTIHPVVLVV